MQKLMKNWVFTMITCILLSVLMVIMLLGAFEVKGFTLAQDILHLLVAVVLGIYIIFTLFPMIVHYRGVPQLFVGVEIVLLIIAIVALVFAQVNVPFFSSLQVCSVVGLAIWLRGAVEIIHAYTLQATQNKKKTPLWALCLYILLSAFGVWQMANPTIEDKHFLFVIGGISLVMAVIFGYATAQNRKAAYGGKKKKKKAKKGSEDSKPVAALEEPKPVVAEKEPVAAVTVTDEKQ
ncbi:MAG: hypothetical protein IJF45_03960 [Clostridia bacterium]|nr:hypothetical protein [Clostridia bacterium]